MKITRVETIPVQVPLHPGRAIRGARGYHRISPFLLVRIHTDDGITGVGEASCTPRWSGEDHFTAAHFVNSYFAPLLEGEDPAEVDRLAEKIHCTVARNSFTKAALEMALWDIRGKIAGLPLYRLFGGPVRESVPLKWSVSGVGPAEAAEIARWAVGQGFTAMKVKVGIDPDGDVARVRSVWEAVGSAVRLGVDANGGWSVPVAIRTIRRLAEFNISFVEQPVPPPDPTWMAEVRNQISIPVIADESVWTAEDAENIVRAHAADVLSVYVGKAGGLSAARKVAAVAEAAGLQTTVGSNLEMGVGSAAMIHLAMATHGIRAEEFPCDIIGPYYYLDDLLEEPLPLAGGQALALERPGLGVNLDMEKVEFYRVR